MHTEPSVRRTVRLAPGFHKAANQHDGPAPLWKAIGVNRTTLHRVSRGETTPSTAFIAGALHAFPQHDFDDLFEVVTAPQQ
jgi:hypothetical protein